MVRSFLFVVCAFAFACCTRGGDYLDPSEAISAMTVADGIEVKTFASEPEIVSISNMDVDHRGRVWACECVNYRGNNGKRPEGDRILILEDTDGDGHHDKTTVFYQGRDIDIAMGLCVLGNKAIVSVAPEILLLEDTDGDDRADKKTVLFRSDAEFQHDHSLHSFVFGPDGRFYFNFGNTGKNLLTAKGEPITERHGRIIQDDGKPFHGGMVLRCDRDFKNVEVLGHNFRNNYEATVDSFGRVWQSDNDDDGNLGVRLNYVLEGGNYGYRDELTGARWQTHRIGQHPSLGKRHWHQNDPGSVPNVIETGNGAPTCITVYEGDLLPERFRNRVIHCDAGPHVVWALDSVPQRAGFAGRMIDIVRSSDPNFRPVDVAAAPDGSLFVSDWHDPVVGGFKQDDIERGRIYRIAPPNHRSKTPKWNLDSIPGAIEALRSPNFCARYLAWTRLHSAGQEAVPALSQLAADPDPRIRSRAIWLLGQIPNQESSTIELAASDRHEEIRVVAIRLSDLLRRDIPALADRLASDPSPRVRAEAALHLRHDESPDARRAWAKLAATYQGGDRWFLEALGIGADGKWDSYLQEYREQLPDQASLHPDLIWRSRSNQTPSLLAQLLLDEPDAVLPRYVRAFDFQSGASLDETLIRLANSDRIFAPDVMAGILQRISSERLAQSPGLRKRIIELLKSSSLDPQMLRWIVELRLTEASDHLLKVATDAENELQVAAVETLSLLGEEERIRSAIQDPKSASIAVALAKSSLPSRIEWLKPFLTNRESEPSFAKAAARELAQSTAGATQLLAWNAADQLPESVQVAVAGPLQTHRDGSVRAAAAKVFPAHAARDNRTLPPMNELLAMKGDSERGKQVYLGSGKCIQCHTLQKHLQNTGKSVGPDLSDVGTKLARPAMLDAILYPSAAISHNFESYVAVTLSGQVIVGLLEANDEQHLQLRDQQGVLRTIPKSEIEEYRKVSISLMPDGLAIAMSTQELVDLLDFLQTLR